MTEPLPLAIPRAYLVAPKWPVLRVHGPDSASWLNGIVTCNVLAVGQGQGVWGSLLTKQGKIRADLQIVGTAEELFVAVSGGDVEEVLSTLDSYLVMEDAEIEVTARQCVVGLTKEARELLDVLGCFAAALPWGEVADVFLATMSPQDWSTMQSDERVRTLLVNETALDADRLHLGVPKFGVDYGASDNPHAASLERRTVDWSKGCYLGQEVVCMQDMRGKVKRRLVRLRGPTGASLPATGDVVLEGKAVGTATSSAQNVAIASVTAPHFDPGTVLSFADQQVTVEALA